MKLPLPKGIYLLIFIVIALSILGYYSWHSRETRQLKRLTTEAPAAVTHTEVIRYVDPIFGNERSHDTDVSFEYEIAGMKYQRTVRMSKTEAQLFVPWGAAKVCYDPFDRKTIEQAAVFPSGYVCGK